MIASSSAVIGATPRRRKVDRLLSTTVVAQRLRCSESKVRRLCESGEIRAGRLGEGGHWRVTEDAFWEFYDRHFGTVDPSVTFRRKNT